MTEERNKNPQTQSVAEWIRDYVGEDKVDMSKFAHSDSKDLKAADFLGQNLKVVISAVTIREYPEKDGKPANAKPVLSFAGKEKGLVVNPTNTKILNNAYGKDSEDWVGHEIGLSTQEYDNYQPGWVVQPLDVAAPDFDYDIPF